MDPQLYQSEIKKLLANMGRIHFTSPFSEEEVEGVFSNGKHRVLSTAEGIWLEDKPTCKKMFFTGEKAFPIFARVLASKISPSFNFKFKGRIYNRVILAPSEFNGKDIFVDSRGKKYFIHQERTRVTMGLYDLLVGEGGEAGMLSLPILYPPSSPKVVLSSSLKEAVDRTSLYTILSRVVTKSAPTQFISQGKKYNLLSSKNLESSMEALGINLPMETVEILNPTQSDETQLEISSPKTDLVLMSLSSMTSNTAIKSEYFVKDIKLSEILSAFASIGINIDIMGKSRIPYRLYSAVQKKLDSLGMKAIHKEAGNPPLKIVTESAPLSNFFEGVSEKVLIQQVTASVDEEDPIWKTQKILEDLGFIYTFEDKEDIVLFTVINYEIAGEVMLNFLMKRVRDQDLLAEDIILKDGNVYLSVKRWK